MHILVGALAGGAFALVTVVAFALITGKKPELKTVLLATLGGAVAGAVTTATLGASSMVGVGLGRQAVAFAAGGAAGGGAERVADNAMEGRELHDGVGQASVVGAGVGLVSLGSTKVLRHVGARVLRNLPAGESRSFGARLFGAATPGTGGTWLRAPGAGRALWRALGGGADKDKDEDAEVRAQEAPAQDAVAPAADDLVEAIQSEPQVPRGPPTKGLLGALE